MIIYFDNGSNPFTSYFEQSGYKIITPYNKKLKVKLIKLFERFNLLHNFLYNYKEIHTNQSNSIIVFDSNITPLFLEWLKKNFPNNRIILWYWNPVENQTTTIKPDEIPHGIEKWSYSPKDCSKYNLIFNTTFYFDCLASQYKKNNYHKKTKALFIGRDKGRLAELQNLKNRLEKIGVDCEFHIIRDTNIKNSSYEKPIPYSRVVEMLADADVIVDYYIDDNAGLSLRPMEAMFLNKKIITNNKTIKNYDFYCPENIYILGNEIYPLKIFIQNKYKIIEGNVIQNYLFSNWLKRFGE